MDVKAEGELIHSDDEPGKVPEPIRGARYYYCPHVTVEVVREKRKKPRYVHIKCKFRTLRIKRYRRHYRHLHGTSLSTTTNVVQEKAA